MFTALFYHTQHAVLSNARVFPNFTVADLVVTGENSRTSFSFYGKKPFAEMELVGKAPENEKHMEATFDIHGVTAISMEKWRAVDKDYFWNVVKVTTDEREIVIHLHSNAVREDTVVVY